ncbi:MAG TPA: 3-phosphoshikimate 1-carboxyvinyltransferase [Pirellulaceae bacterium]|jgi:3-phosphoshikimate 1-carboxyvinyltransferase
MSKALEIQTAAGPIRGQVRPPGSKSITNRALVCAALADGVSQLSGALDSEDTRVMVDGLGRLGIEVESQEAGTRLLVHGAGGEIPALEADLFCANSGTTVRFLTALATLGHGSFRLDGVERMRQRPIGDLLEALNQMGTHASSENGNNCPPVVVHANGLPGGVAKIRGDISSQYLSGVLMAAPRARGLVELMIDGRLVSRPYVRMTLAVMKSFGVSVKTSGELQQFQIPAPQQYAACEYPIEPDASAASYFWAAAATCGGEVTVEGLTANSLQGDVAFVECLEKMGCEVRRDSASITVIGRPLLGIDVDMNAISDTVQTLAVVAIFAEGPTRIREVGHIRHKETDRIGAVATELRKLGVEVLEHDDGLTIKPGNSRELKPATIETYHDHRMAMSFALAGLRIPGVQIANPSCVEKTYPLFFEDLTKLVR